MKVGFLLLVFITFVASQPKSFESSFNWKDLRWIDDKVAILLTDEGFVYRSDDTGLNWMKLNDQLPQSLQPGYEPRFLYPSTVDPTKFYIRGASQVSWISNDKGQSWRSVQTGQVLYNLDWHPTQSNWVLARDFDGEVYGSFDFGTTWFLVTSNAYAYTWGDAGVGEVPKERIYLTIDDEDYYQIVVTDDWGYSNASIVSRGVDFEFHEKQVFAAVWYGFSDSITLKVSPDLGMYNKMFYDGVFPNDATVENHAFAILDDHTGAVFMGVIHEDIYFSDYGNLYVSDATGARYSNSLQHIHQEYAVFDFARIHGLEGIYIANHVIDITDANSGSRSVITFDNGNTWNAIRPPHFDSLNNTVICSGTCSLHIHCATSQLDYGRTAFGSVLSTYNAIGLIIANGNIGDSVAYDTDLVNTYLSRDGGITWIELMKGPSYFQLGDHGSIIMLIPSSVTSSTLYYTLDYGTTPVVAYQFTQDPITVSYIVREDTSTQEKFTILGTRQDGSNAVIGIDFTSVFTTTCNLYNDYELWAPTNANGTCLLGRNINYWRRIASRTCFNNELVDHVANSTSCTCTEDDWECDYDFTRDDDGVCQYDLGPYDPVYPPDNCHTGGHYFKVNGYRKEAGNNCSGGVDHTMDGPFDCPDEGGVGRKGWIAAAVLLPLILITLIAAGVALRSETVREKLPFLKFLATWKVGYFGMSSQPNGSTSILDDEDDTERENEEFSIQAEEIEEQQIENLEKKAPQKPKSNDTLIQMDDLTDATDDFNPRK